MRGKKHSLEFEEEVLKVIRKDPNINYKELMEIFGYNRYVFDQIRRKHGLNSMRSRKSTEQSKLRKQGLQKCWKCNRILEINYENFSPQNRTCKPCCNARNTKIYYDTFTSLEKLFTHKLELAKRRNKNGLEFSLTLKDVLEKYELQKGKCFYSKRDFVLEVNHPCLASIDRIDSSKGYTKENTVLCCSEINYMKQDLKLERFLENCKLIYKNFSSI